MTETVVTEGQYREVPDDAPRALVALPQQSVQVGLGAVANLSDEQFTRNLELLKKSVERAKLMQQALLEEGVDYGTVPGINRPFLHKPGAEKFEKAYGYALSYAVERKVGDGDKTPELEYIVHAKVHLGDTDGPVVGEGLGSCNTHETKYRYRQAKHTCPDCQKETVIKGRADGKLKGKWWCATGQGGCGHTFAPDDKRLTEQVVGQVENENPYDLANTILKMARKRAGVDAILTATGTSGLFSQDDDSPSVQRDAASSGGQASGGAKQPDLPKMPKLPAIPKGLTEERSLGTVDVRGVIELSESGMTDGQVRDTPKGPLAGFRLTFAEGRIPQVLVPGPLATSLAEKDSPAGLAATVVGELFAVPWQKDGEQMPPFYRLVAHRIETEAWTIDDRPAPTPAEPESKPKRSTKKPAAGADAAESGPTDDAEGTPAPAAGPGLTAEQFKALAKEARVAVAFLESVAVNTVGKPLDQLTDADRHQVALAAELYAPED